MTDRESLQAESCESTGNCVRLRQFCIKMRQNRSGVLRTNRAAFAWSWRYEKTILHCNPTCAACHNAIGRPAAERYFCDYAPLSGVTIEKGTLVLFLRGDAAHTPAGFLPPKLKLGMNLS
jgi:hypothetical protein